MFVWKAIVYRSGGRAAAILATVVSALLLSAGLAAGATPAIDVAPASGLSSGQQVSVTGSGFSADASVYVGQCDSTGEICDFADAQPVTADGAGNLSATLVVRSEFDGHDWETGQPAGAMSCTSSPLCTVFAGNLSERSSLVVISFG
jgi:hypothetical protein